MQESPPKKKGLSPEHHGDLNRPAEGSYPGGKTARNARILELRKVYSDDPVALQQIDIYDDSTEYHVKMSEYIDAIKKRDEKNKKNWKHGLKNTTQI